MTQNGGKGSLLCARRHTWAPPVLLNGDIADIHAYPVPKPADYKSIPLLNQ
jgi:hypothetical protein